MKRQERAKAWKKRQAQDVLFQSRHHDYRTPPELFNALDAEFHFTLDVAADAENTLCAEYYDKQIDALTQDWEGVCFLNPPFGERGPASQTERSRRFGLWLKKAAESAKTGATVVALIPARTDTHWFHDHVLPHAELRFIRGRQRFPRPGDIKTKSATFPSIIAIYRPARRDP